MEMRFNCLSRPLAFLTLIVTASGLSVAEVPFPSKVKFEKAFAAVDTNSDQRVSQEEFLANRSSGDVSKRDFLLFDRDRDGFLTFEEFTSVPGVVEGTERGPIPDPILAILKRVIADVDESCQNWNEHPDVELDPQKVPSIRLQGRSGQEFTLDVGSSDFDGNGQVSRDEMRRYLEHQLGICRADGKLLRHPDGRVFNYMLFLRLDQNQDDEIQRTEYIKQADFTKEPEREFDAGDRDGNRTVTFEEWWNFPDRGTDDPIEEFRSMDTNFDAFVSPEELASKTADWKKPIATHAFPAFDVNGDGRLSLSEYQSTPQANFVLPWEAEVWDRDSDGLISFNEFNFNGKNVAPTEADQFPLLRFIYFCQYDLNSDGKLDPNEYTYRRKVPNEIFSLNEDGTDWKSVFRLKGHPMCGSVAVSPDSKFVAFEAAAENQLQEKILFVVELGHDNPRRLCFGMMPTWSADGKFLAFTRNAAESIWLLDLETNKEEALTQGWSAQWSPDGRKISFFDGRDIKVYDFITEEIVAVVSREQHPYQRFFWNMSWSPDSRQLCFKGLTADNKQELVTADLTVQPPKMKVRHSGSLNLNADSAWHPNGNRVVFSTMCESRGFMQLYEFNPNNDDAPTLVKGQDEKRNNLTTCWTPDGKHLIVTSGDY